jgi:hypothetical protein
MVYPFTFHRDDGFTASRAGTLQDGTPYYRCEWGTPKKPGPVSPIQWKNFFAVLDAKSGDVVYPGPLGGPETAGGTSLFQALYVLETSKAKVR